MLVEIKSMWENTHFCPLVGKLHGQGSKLYRAVFNKILIYFHKSPFTDEIKCSTEGS